MSRVRTLFGALLLWLVPSFGQAQGVTAADKPVQGKQAQGKPAQTAAYGEAYRATQREYVAYVFKQLEAVTPAPVRATSWYQSMKTYVRNPGEGACSLMGNTGSADYIKGEVTVCISPPLIAAQFGIAGALVSYDLTLRLKSVGLTPSTAMGHWLWRAHMNAVTSRIMDYYRAELRQQHYSFITNDLSYRNCSPIWVARQLAAGPITKRCDASEAPAADVTWAERVVKEGLGEDERTGAELLGLIIGSMHFDAFAWSIAHEVAHMMIYHEDGRKGFAEMQASIAFEKDVDKLAASLIEKLPEGLAADGVLNPTLLWIHDDAGGPVATVEAAVSRHGIARARAYLEAKFCTWPGSAQIAQSPWAGTVKCP